MQNLPDLNFKYDHAVMLNVFRSLLNAKEQLWYGLEAEDRVIAWYDPNRVKDWLNKSKTVPTDPIFKWHVALFLSDFVVNLDLVMSLFGGETATIFNSPFDYLNERGRSLYRDVINQQTEE